MAAIQSHATLLIVILFFDVISASYGRALQMDQSRSQTSNIKHREFPMNSLPCFEDKCFCLDSTADCSRNYGRLMFIPAFSRRITHLIFSFNNLTAIPIDTFFDNVTMILMLDLRNNGLRCIHPMAFQHLTSLQNLNLDYNLLNYSSLIPVFSSKRLERLFIRYMNLGPLPEDYFARDHIPCLKLVDLTGNRIRYLNMSVFLSLKCLSVLRVADNHITSVISDHLPQLQILDLQTNALFDFPQSCKNKSSLFPQLLKLFFAQNVFSKFSDSICLPMLRLLDLSKNAISFFVHDMFSEELFPNLRTLGLQSVENIQRIEQFAFRSPTLEILTLMRCNIPFSDSKIHPQSFAGIPNLISLQVSHNLGSYIPNQKFSQLFGELKSLEKLYMGDFGLQVITRETFSNLSRLTTLNLYRNKLINIPDGAFDSMPNLTSLGLNDNQLETLSENTFSPFIRNRLQYLDVSGNPFLCDCDLLWFKEWFDSAPWVFNKSFGKYACNNNPSELLKHFSPNKYICFLGTRTCKIFIACASVFIVVLLVSSFIYPNRWYIRFILFRFCRGRSDLRRRRLQETDFKYDLFVSYANNDLPWVQQHLIPALEEQLKLRLCIHQRDFVPGNNIVDNIVESVEASKKIMMVFSNHFLTSHWCQFELSLCQRYVMENDDALVVVCLGDVTSLNVTRTMRAVLSITTYIQWDDDPHMRNTFWTRVKLALINILPAPP